ncbi:MAG: hypothetical protein K2H89_04770 [Oscillospiraceae bacterium]|nr:hypothetical protein [Oscillospiraceae bacterium]
MDCFKHLCIAYDDKYKGFEFLYKNIDLSLIDNGTFYQNCAKKKNRYSIATGSKKVEFVSEDVEDSFSDFEEAYNAYAEVFNMINDSYQKLECLKRKALKKERWRTILDILGIIGSLFGIIGVILTIYYSTH